MVRVRLFAAYLLLVLMGIGIGCSKAQAQNAGNTGTLTTSVQLLNNASGTGRTVVPPKNSIGASVTSSRTVQAQRICFFSSSWRKVPTMFPLTTHKSPLGTDFPSP